MPDSRAKQLIAAGEFRRAAEWLDTAHVSSQGNRILRTHIELEIGDTAAAREQAEVLLREHLDSRSRAYCLSLAGRALGRLGSVHDSIGYQRKAVALASAYDNHLESELLAHLVAGLLNWIGIEPAVAELPRLRRASLASGNTRSLVEYHIVNARVATMRGLLQRAEAESQIASRLLERSANAIQLWKVRQIQSNIAIKASDMNSAFAHAKECLALAESSGSRLSIGTTLGNLAHIATMTGHFNHARQYLERAMDSLDPASHMRIAAFSTGIELGLAQGDYSFAEDMIVRRDSLGYQNKQDLPYYDLWFELNRVRWMLFRGRFSEAAACSTSALGVIEKLADADLLDRMTLVAAEAHAMAGSHDRAVRLFAEVCRANHEATLGAFAETNRVAAVLASPSSRDDARSYLARAVRILTTAGLLGCRTEVFRTASQLGIPLDDASTVVGNPVGPFQALSAALQLAKHPKVFGTEVLSLLSSLDLCDEAVVAEEDGGRFSVLDAMGCSIAGGQNIFRNPAALTLQLGVDRGRSYVLKAVLKSDAGRGLVWPALAQVVRSATTLASNRTTTEEQVALWPIEATTHPTGFVVAAENMQELVKTTLRLATSNITVLISGETGTGKELLARAVHDGSPRKDKPFIPFNCSAVPRDMLDAQLFGYRRGAFTGAHDAFQGVIRAAAGGTLFLDEIGEITPAVQPKLLRFLESGEIHPLGEPKPLVVDVRIVAATNANLEQLVADGRFREDLFYRLNVVRLEVPPLRERREEIPLLVQHYLDRCSRESQKTGLRLAEETMEYLILYKWPGNVRQLANEMRRLVALAESGAVLMPEHLSPDLAASRRTIPASERDLAPTEFVVRMDQPMSAAIEHLERSMIQYAFKLSNGVEEAAQILGLSRKGLYLKRQRLGILDQVPTPDHVAATKPAPALLGPESRA